MTDYTAHEIHRLDQAYPDAVNTIDDLTGDPARKARLAEVGPEVFAAELTRDLANSAANPISLAAWAAVATVQLMVAGKSWEDDTDAAWAKVDQLTAKIERRRLRLVEAENDLLNVRGILSPNGRPRRLPADVDLVPNVAPAVEWLADRVDELTAELAKTQEQLTAANRRADGLQNDLDSATKANTAYANENARLRQDRDTQTDIANNRADVITQLTKALEKANKPDQLTAYANEDEQYLIWSQHHQSWWGPSRSGYRSNPADAGRYTLAAAQAEMARGCYCCRVPEVPVAAGKAIGRGDRAIQAAITEATELAIAAGQENKAYDVAEAIR
ncbi:hypothetical protein PSN13_06533 [Micromonospora saelicesensis]|uniref:Uncharacterized protein n=1 Tax=Micromonospora saelicesensis TaxID=285676 RepID=A0A328NH44_9ACTN|nr:hypothetical protein [Micromonospora saelicesensis]RAO26505.1 hypothetical protein PSN13_06533 [Micromonospora saelicesensis]